jgi:hypothetical protein
MINTLIFLSCACLLVSLIGLAMLCRVLIENEEREREWQECFARFLAESGKREGIIRSGTFHNYRRN